MFDDAVLIAGVGLLGYYAYTQYGQITPAPNALQTALAIDGGNMPAAPIPTSMPVASLWSKVESLFGDTPSQSSNTAQPETVSSFVTGLVQPLGQIFSVNDSTAGSGSALDIAKQRLIQEEGQFYVVYKDKLGVLTGGIGHKITAADNMKLGDNISQAQIDAWFTADTSAAYVAAQQQAQDLGNINVNFIAALIDVNFQLGTGWPREFSTTYALLKTGNISQAIQNIENSLWYKQTPERAQAFADAIDSTFTSQGVNV